MRLQIKCEKCSLQSSWMGYLVHYLSVIQQKLSEGVSVSINITILLRLVGGNDNTNWHLHLPCLCLRSIVSKCMHSLVNGFHREH